MKENQIMNHLKNEYFFGLVISYSFEKFLLLKQVNPNYM